MRAQARRSTSRSGSPPSDEASTKIQRLSDGRDIAICHTPMRDGGWVTTHEDVTERESLKWRLKQQNDQLDAALNNMTQGWSCSTPTSGWWSATSATSRCTG